MDSTTLWTYSLIAGVAVILIVAILLTLIIVTAKSIDKHAKNIWAVGGGVQQKVSKSIKILAGYNYSGNPVPAKYTFFNTPAPAIVQHHVSGGFIQSLGKCDLIVTYYHAFQNSISGPWISPQGPIAGTSVTSKMSENSVTIGFGKSF